MWLSVLRSVLYGLVLLVLVLSAFVGGMAVHKKTARQPLAAGAAEVPAERREASRGFVEAALAARFSGRHTRALEYFEQARHLDPERRGLDYQIGLTCLDMGDFDAAEVAARRSIEKDEETSNALALLGLARVERGRQRGAFDTPSGEAILRSVRESREEDPLNPMPLYVLAEYYRSSGEPAQAVEAYQRALERVSKSDSILIATVKAGLSGIRLHHEPGRPPLKLQRINGVVPPEQLIFGAADALMRGDREMASGYLQEARGRLPEPVFEALLQDSFFQDYLDPSILESSPVSPSQDEPVAPPPPDARADDEPVAGGDEPGDG